MKINLQEPTKSSSVLAMACNTVFTLFLKLAVHVMYYTLTHVGNINTTTAFSI